MKTTMKFLTVMFLSLMILTSSCTKKDNPAPQPVVPPIISLVDLNGTWNFQNYELNGTSYTECSQVPINEFGGFIILTLKFTNSNICEEIDPCNSVDFSDIPFTLNTTTNILTLENQGTPLTYQVISYDSSTKLLKIKNTLNNGINTLKKQ